MPRANTSYRVTVVMNCNDDDGLTTHLEFVAVVELALEGARLQCQCPEHAQDPRSGTLRGVAVAESHVTYMFDGNCEDGCTASIHQQIGSVVFAAYAERFHVDRRRNIGYGMADRPEP